MWEYCKQNTRDKGETVAHIQRREGGRPGSITAYLKDSIKSNYGYFPTLPTCSHSFCQMFVSHYIKAEINILEKSLLMAKVYKRLDSIDLKYILITINITIINVTIKYQGMIFTSPTDSFLYMGFLTLWWEVSLKVGKTSLIIKFNT